MTGSDTMSYHHHADFVVTLGQSRVRHDTIDNPDEGGDVLDDVWRQWKERHQFTTASWDFLLSAPKADYFR